MSGQRDEQRLASRAASADGSPMEVDGLTTSLARTADVRGASWAVVEWLGAPGLRPSIYIERGGRLRCQALAGYPQLLDGMPPWAGVIGTAYATGEPSVVRDVREDPTYLEAADGVVAQVCLPLLHDGRAVGAVSVEATRPLTLDDLARASQATDALARRIHSLGGPLPESPSQRLVRHAITLAGEQDAAAIEREVVAAAVDVTPLDSAVLLSRPSADEPFVAGCHFGPLGSALAGTPPQAIASLAAFTSAGCSVYTVAGERPGPDDGPGTAALRTAGATSMAVLPAGPDRILVVADTASIQLTTEHCELLELLAAQASACLRTAASVDALRTLAATDALTGLGHHATFHARLAEASTAGNVGVLMIDIDHFKEYNDRLGHPEGDRALKLTATALAGALRRDDALFRIGGDEFAALLPGVDEATALEIAWRLHRAVAPTGTGLRVSIGAAAARPEEPAARLLVRADRALYAAKGSGRDAVALDEPTPVVEAPS